MKLTWVTSSSALSRSGVFTGAIISMNATA